MCVSLLSCRRLWPTFALLLVLSGAFTGCNKARALPEAFGGLHLVDQDERVVDGRWLGDRMLVVRLMFTSCPAACPRVTQLLAEARRQLSPEVQRELRILSVPVDPDNDTPSALARFAREQGVDVPEWRFARASAEDVRTLAARLTSSTPRAPRRRLTP